MSENAILDDYIARLSRWGQWGDDDELGALNLVGPEQVREAASHVRDGKVISLALPFDQDGPLPGGLRQNPQLLTTATGTRPVRLSASDRGRVDAIARLPTGPAIASPSPMSSEIWYPEH